MASSTKRGDKLLGKLEEEVSNEAIGIFRRWRQKSKNGVLPIGIAHVGKTTFLTKFDADAPSLFLDFNRTLKTKVDSLRLRQDFLDRCNGVEYYKKIDVPGDLPDQWAAAFFDNSPRVLVVMVDERNPEIHVKQLRTFLTHVQQGPSVWQRAKAIFGLRQNNLTRVLFVVNKVDRFASAEVAKTERSYQALLADIQSLLGAPIQMFKTALTTDAENSLEVFHAVLDGLARK